LSIACTKKSFSYDLFDLHNVFMVHPSHGLNKKIKRMTYNIINIRQVAKQQSPSLIEDLCTLPKE
jgi:hypothetical protein